MYLERLSTSGISDRSSYYKPSGVFNRSDYSSDNQMPNCTAYAYLRAFEATNADIPYPIAKPTIGYGHAKTWYDNSPLKKGTEIKSGSIACFDGNFGHVAFVERKIDDTHCLITESQYDKDKSLRNYKYWQKRVVELIPGKATLAGVGKLQGFLYLDIDDVRTQRNSLVEQVEIIEDMVNVRKSPDGEVVQKGCYCPMGIYNVISKKQLDGYTWYEIDNSNWIREGKWLIHYNPAYDYEELRKENELLKSKLNMIKEILQ